MTDTNNTVNLETTIEFGDVISNLETLLNLHSLESDSENDKDAVAEMTSLYGHVLIKDFNVVRDKVRKLERFYSQFHQDLE
jgi:hypothetical protein